MMWTTEDDAALLAAAEASGTVEEAIAEASRRTGRNVTRYAADSRLKRMGRASLVSVIADGIRRRAKGTNFADVMNAIEAEAKSEGPQAVAELDAMRDHFRGEVTALTANDPVIEVTWDDATDPAIDVDALGVDVSVPAGGDASTGEVMRNVEVPAQVPTNCNAGRTSAESPEDRDHRSEFRLRNQVRDLESAKKQLLKDLEDREAQIDALRELRAAKPLPKIEHRHVVGATQRQGCPVMFLSDWHVEEPVDPGKVNGLNRYNMAIADKCIESLPDAYEWLMRDGRYDCRTGIVALGGDLYSGYIHEELMESNGLSPVQTIVWLQERIERMLRRIAETTKLERIIVPCVDGNHGRNTHKTRVSTRTANSLEWLLYQTIAARMADDPRLEFQIAEGEWLFLDVFKTSIAFTHGDHFKYGGGVGGISIPLRRGINEMRKYRKIDVTVLGHFHQRSDFGDIVVNGSMIGVSPYSIHIHAPPESRQQTWFMVDSERGKCLSAPVWMPTFPVAA